MARFPEKQDPDSQPASGGSLNRTNLGTQRSGQQGVLSIYTGSDPLKGTDIGLPNAPSVLTLDAVNASTGAITTNFLWVDGNGKLRISTTFPVTADSDGVVVGSQS